jgi:hypothetical protein
MTSRFRSRSSRSAISVAGTAMSREQVLQTRVLDAFSLRQYGHIMEVLTV